MQLGYNKLIWGFSHEYLRGVDETTMVPYDTMHVEADGLCRMELAYLLYMLITKRKYFKLAELNDAIKRFSWPPGHRMPEIDHKVIEGRKGGVPRADAHLFSSASQTMHFAMARCDPLCICD